MMHNVILQIPFKAKAILHIFGKNSGRTLFNHSDSQLIGFK